MLSKKPTSKDIQRSLEYLQETFVQFSLLINKTQKSFADTPNGMEVHYLEPILERYVKPIRVFVDQFISGEKGKRKVDQFLENLLHTDSHIKPDEQLVKKLRKALKNLEKTGVIDINEWRFYNALLSQAESISINNIKTFSDDFRTLLNKAVFYPNTRIAEIIKKNNTAKTPNITKLENLGLALFILKILIKNLAFPEQETRAKEIIAKAEESLYYDTQTCIKKIAKELKLPEKVVFTDLSKAFGDNPDPVEKLTFFAENYVNKGKAHIIYKALSAISYEDFAKHIAKAFVKRSGLSKTVISDMNSLNIISGMILRLTKDDSVTQLEVSAKEELITLIKDQIKIMNKSLEKNKTEFEAALSSRINTLKKEAGKYLKTLEKDNLQFRKLLSRILIVENVATDTIKKRKKIASSRRQIIENQLDYSAILDARFLLWNHYINKITNNELQTQIQQLAEKRSEFGKNAIKTILKMYLQGNQIQKIDAYISQLDAWSDKTLKAIDPLFDRAEELDQKIEQVSEPSLFSIREAEKFAAKIHKKHLVNLKSHTELHGEELNRPAQTNQINSQNKTRIDNKNTQ